MLTFQEYKEEILNLSFGKKVGKNLYLIWDDLKQESQIFESLLSPLFQESEGLLIKFFTDQFKISLLNYPDFFTEPHPALKKSRTIDLTTGKQRTIDYSKHKNPPILHRKETMISPNRKEYRVWKELTIQLEKKGCFVDAKRIGFKEFWDERLASKGLYYDGHTLKQKEVVESKNETDFPKIERHKTAMSRADFSRPVQLLFKNGLLNKELDFFDYGCGLGDDVRALQYNGYKATGWDPVHNPEGDKVKADVVNLGFVLNVIEDTSERLDVLHEAFNLANKILSIAVVTDTAPTAKDIRPYKDGFLTSRGTFQKFFKHEEVQELIEEALNCSAHAVSPGIFLVFLHEQDGQDFLSSRQKRRVDWNQLNMHIYPSKDERDEAKKEILYQKYKDDIEAYWEQLLQLGRIPSIEEYPDGKKLVEHVGMNHKRLQEWFAQRYGQEVLEEAFDKRRDDLLVYLGLANFKKRVPFTGLSTRLQRDMKTYFGSYKSGQQEALTELFKIGNPNEIEERCITVNKKSQIGKLDEQALYISFDDLVKLDPILRMYVGVAGMLYGDLNDVAEIKIHTQSGKVSFFVKEAPDLELGEYWRIKVELGRQKVHFYKHKKV